MNTYGMNAEINYIQLHYSLVVRTVRIIYAVVVGYLPGVMVIDSFVLFPCMAMIHSPSSLSFEYTRPRDDATHHISHHKHERCSSRVGG